MFADWCFIHLRWSCYHHHQIFTSTLVSSSPGVLVILPPATITASRPLYWNTAHACVHRALIIELSTRLNGNCCEFCWSCLVQVWKSLNQSAVPAVSKGHDFHNWTQKFFAPYDSWPTAKIQLEHNTFHLSIAVFSEYYSPFHRVDGIALASFTILIGKFDNKAKRTFVFVALCLLRSFATDTCHANAKIDRWRWQHQNILM